MSSELPECADCYARGERLWMRRFQAWRAITLRPMLRRLGHWGVRADHMTLLSLAAGLAFCPLFFVAPWAACVTLGLHALLDGLDGPLARQQRTASPRGSFTDTSADQLVVAASTMTLMGAGVVGLVPGALYVFLYTVVVAFAMVRNALHVPYSWLLRPRFIVYSWIAVEVWVLPGSIDVVLWLVCAVLSINVASGFWKIRRRLGKPAKSRGIRP